MIRRVRWKWVLGAWVWVGVGMCVPQVMCGGASGRRGWGGEWQEAGGGPAGGARAGGWEGGGWAGGGGWRPGVGGRAGGGGYGSTNARGAAGVSQSA